MMAITVPVAVAAEVVVAVAETSIKMMDTPEEDMVRVKVHVCAHICLYVDARICLHVHVCA